MSKPYTPWFLPCGWITQHLPVIILQSLSINEFLKPAEGETYYSGGARGRGRGRGFRGSSSGSSGTSNYGKAPAIEDPSQFPTLGGKWTLLSFSEPWLKGCRVFVLLPKKSDYIFVCWLYVKFCCFKFLLPCSATALHATQELSFRSSPTKSSLFFILS